jgi:hypothetical protein
VHGGWWRARAGARVLLTVDPTPPFSPEPPPPPVSRARCLSDHKEGEVGHRPWLDGEAQMEGEDGVRARENETWIEFGRTEAMFQPPPCNSRSVGRAEAGKGRLLMRAGGLCVWAIEGVIGGERGRGGGAFKTAASTATAPMAARARGARGGFATRSTQGTLARSPSLSRSISTVFIVDTAQRYLRIGNPELSLLRASSSRARLHCSMSPPAQGGSPAAAPPAAAGEDRPIKHIAVVMGACESTSVGSRRRACEATQAAVVAPPSRRLARAERRKEKHVASHAHTPSSPNTHTQKNQQPWRPRPSPSSSTSA